MDQQTPLTVVGRPYHSEYWQLLQHLSVGKNIKFITEASDEDLIRNYQSCAIKVFPSVYDTVYGDHTDLPEYLGFTAMEAMSCEMPVIASDVGAMSEVVADGITGFLVPPNNPSAIREKLRLLLGAPKLRSRLGEAGRDRILEHFTWHAVAAKCLNAYSQ
jgi:glycosyltransferase involved in cell wall biosynthesis